MAQFRMGPSGRLVSDGTCPGTPEAGGKVLEGNVGRAGIGNRMCLLCVRVNGVSLKNPPMWASTLWHYVSSWRGRRKPQIPIAEW